MTVIREPSLTSKASNAERHLTEELHFVRVFSDGPGGGNPAPVVLNADAMSSIAMKEIASRYGRESAFVCDPHDPTNTFRLRFFVPEHEMEMCGHATLGAMWLLRRLGRWTSSAATIETLSGTVDVCHDDRLDSIRVSQPQGRVDVINDAAMQIAIREALRIDAADLGSLGIVNATTSRTKTLIPIRSVESLHTLAPSFDAVRTLCDALGSTGLYPFAVEQTCSLKLHARQFPRSSGYPEDAATGIAAAATLYGALHYGLLAGETSGMSVLQGRAMGKPSRIDVMMRDPGDPAKGCWISGTVENATLESIR